MQDFFLARQPILNRQENLVAFELLFRSSQTNRAAIINDTQATAEVLLNAFGELGIASVLGAHQGFINVGASLLHSDVIELLPPQKVVLELLETIEINEALVTRCRELKTKGYTLALDDVTHLNDGLRELLPLVAIVKLDLLAIHPAQLGGLLRELRTHPVKLLAEKVETRAQVTDCLELGFDLFQGYYFARPELMSGKKVSPAKLALLKVLALMMSGAEIEKIEEAFKAHADLTFNLLRLVNSAAIGLTRKINSLRHGLALLGRRPLMRWVQLLVYSAEGNASVVSPLMTMAATRGKLLELLAEQQNSRDADYPDRAFMTGILSLAHVAFTMPLPEVITRLGVHDEVENAILHGTGILGELLKLCELLESGDTASVESWLRQHPQFSLDDIHQAELTALAWANSIAL